MVPPPWEITSPQGELFTIASPEGTRKIPRAGARPSRLDGSLIQVSTTAQLPWLPLLLLLLLFLLKLVLFLRLRVLLVVFVLSLFRCSFCPVFTLVVVSLKSKSATMEELHHGNR